MGKGEIGNEFKGFLWFMVRLEVLAARFLGWSVEWMVMFLLSHSFSKCLFCNFDPAHKIHLFQPSVCVFGLLFVSPYTLPLSWSELFFFFLDRQRKHLLPEETRRMEWSELLSTFFCFLSSSTSSHLILKPGPTLPSQNTISVTQLQCSGT